jgi:proline dehydrogenase
MLKDSLLYLARNQQLQNFAENGAARGISRRFVAGEALNEAVEATRVLNRHNIQVALDHLGENVTNAKDAKDAAHAYIAAIDLAKQTGIDANISVKLTALGLDISQDLCEENLHSILERSNTYPIFVCVDMEGSAYTDKTMDITLRMHQQFEHVGTVVQSYLYRSKKDVEQLIARGIRVRLVKGAYKEPHPIAYQSKNDVDYNYMLLMKMLLARGNFPAIASHDQAIIDAARRFVRDYGINKDAFEFQMLYGIRRDLQDKLVKEGYKVRVYVPYGSQWYPYFMRRLAERPANLIFILSNAFR